MSINGIIDISETLIILNNVVTTCKDRGTNSIGIVPKASFLLPNCIMKLTKDRYFIIRMFCDLLALIYIFYYSTII